MDKVLYFIHTLQPNAKSKKKRKNLVLDDRKKKIILRLKKREKTKKRGYGLDFATKRMRFCPLGRNKVGILFLGRFLRIFYKLYYFFFIFLVKKLIFIYFLRFLMIFCLFIKKNCVFIDNWSILYLLVKMKKI